MPLKTPTWSRSREPLLSATRVYNVSVECHAQCTQPSAIRAITKPRRERGSEMKWEFPWAASFAVPWPRRGDIACPARHTTWRAHAEHTDAIHQRRGATHSARTRQTRTKFAHLQHQSRAFAAQRAAIPRQRSRRRSGPARNGGRPPCQSRRRSRLLAAAAAAVAAAAVPLVVPVPAPAPVPARGQARELKRRWANRSAQPRALRPRRACHRRHRVSHSALPRAPGSPRKRR